MAGRWLERADGDIVTLAGEVMTRWHSDLTAAEVRLAIVMVHPPTNSDGVVSGPALRLAGASCAALASLASARDRLLAGHDALVRIAADIWEHLPDESQRALLDHELCHFQLARDAKGRVDIHDDGRPKLQLRPDDFVITGMNAAVERHGVNSIEVLAMRHLRTNCQLLFEFAEKPAVRVARGRREPQEAPAGAEVG